MTVGAMTIPDPDTWVADFGDYLYRFALVRVRNPDTAVDLVQETFLAAFDARSAYRGDAAPKTWFAGILNHKILDHFRRTAREFLLREDAAEPLPDMAAMPSAWPNNPVDIFERKEFCETLRRCLEKLDERSHAVYSMREIDELEVEQICNEFGITTTNLRVILHRAREQLRRCLDFNWFGKDSAK